LVVEGGLSIEVYRWPFSTSQGKLIASVMAALAEFERDLLRERVRSGIAAARARGVHFGRRPGQRIKADRVAPRVLALVATGHSYRQVGRLLNISKNTVLDIVKRAYSAQPHVGAV
jgi:putative DNA-invertase from lambdoid prophage Rac